MDKTYFIGGAKGVGKSTMLKEISALAELPVINTGDFFSSKAPKDVVKSRIVDCVRRSHPSIVDTHYAGHTQGVFADGFERALYDDEWIRLCEGITVEPVLIDIDAHALLDRRMSDKLNRRDVDISHIAKELEYTRQYFQEYCAQIGAVGRIIFNYDREQTFEELRAIICPSTYRQQVRRTPKKDIQVHYLL